MGHSAGGRYQAAKLFVRRQWRLAIGPACSFAIDRIFNEQFVGVSPADPTAVLAASAVVLECEETSGDDCAGPEIREDAADRRLIFPDRALQDGRRWMTFE